MRRDYGRRWTDAESSFGCYAFFCIWFLIENLPLVATTQKVPTQAIFFKQFYVENPVKNVKASL